MTFNIIGRFFSILVGYTTIVLITNNYSFAIYGEYILFIVYSSLAVTLSVFGLNKSIISQTEMDFKANTGLKLLCIFIQGFLSVLVCYIFLIFYENTIEFIK